MVFVLGSSCIRPGCVGSGSLEPSTRLEVEGTEGRTVGRRGLGGGRRKGERGGGGGGGGNEGG